MKYAKIVLAGGNGYLGSVLARHYAGLANEVVLLSRKPAPGAAPGPGITTVLWDAQTEGPWVKALEGADLLVNLCGKNVNCRYTRQNKKDIIRSRTVPTALLGKAISGLSNPPKLWINITSATIYRHAEDHSQDEETGEIGEGFSVDVCKRWERVFFAAPTPLTRKVALRMGIVFGPSDGVFPRLLNMVKWGLGGPQGNGHQYVSWIHESDVAAITEWLLNHPSENGVFNATAPQPVPNAQQMRLIRHAYGVIGGLPAPAWLLNIGARVIGTETELILKSRWVLPKRLLDSGFIFQYPDAEDAVLACVQKNTSK